MQNFRTKFTYLLGLSALGLASVSCDTTGQDEFTDEMGALRSVSSNILVHEDFEGSHPFGQVHQQFGASHSFRTVEDPKDKSNKVGRFELRDNDPIASNGKRAEVLFPVQDSRDRWYSYSVMFPSNGFAKDETREIISQWHQSTGGPPTIALKIADDKFFVRAGEKADERKDYPVGDVEKDVWHDFVFHIVHSPNSDGLIEVWKNGEKIMSQKGANMYNMALPRWKVGVYKNTWASRKTATDRRVIFFDNVKLGNQNATLEEMQSRTHSGVNLQTNTATSENQTPSLPSRNSSWRNRNN